MTPIRFVHCKIIQS